jgi:hypothetical protein
LKFADICIAGLEGNLKGDVRGSDLRKLLLYEMILRCDDRGIKFDMVVNENREILSSLPADTYTSPTLT